MSVVKASALPWFIWHIIIDFSLQHEENLCLINKLWYHYALLKFSKIVIGYQAQETRIHIKGFNNLVENIEFNRINNIPWDDIVKYCNISKVEINYPGLSLECSNSNIFISNLLNFKRLKSLKFNLSRHEYYNLRKLKFLGKLTDKLLELTVSIDNIILHYYDFLDIKFSHLIKLSLNINFLDFNLDFIIKNLHQLKILTIFINRLDFRMHKNRLYSGKLLELHLIPNSNLGFQNQLHSDIEVDISVFPNLTACSLPSQVALSFTCNKQKINQVVLHQPRPSLSKQLYTNVTEISKLILHCDGMTETHLSSALLLARNAKSLSLYSLPSTLDFNLPHCPTNYLSIVHLAYPIPLKLISWLSYYYPIKFLYLYCYNFPKNPPSFAQFHFPYLQYVVVQSPFREILSSFRIHQLFQSHVTVDLVHTSNY